MAVDSGMLWSVLGVWGVVWVVAVAAAGIALVVAVVALLRRRTATVLPGLPFFLDEPAAIAICRLGGYGEAVKRTVDRHRKVGKDGSFTIDSRWFKVGGGGKQEDEEHSTYDVDEIADDVLGIVLKALEAGHGIVHVDLQQRVIQGNRAWRRTRTPRLASTRAYVVLDGRFEVVEETEDSTVLVASVGETAAKVRVVCDNRSLRRDRIAHRKFNAWCLGKSEAWDDETGEVVVRPVAVLQ